MFDGVPAENVLARLVEQLVAARDAAGQPEGLNCAEAAKFVGVSPRKWYALVDAGHAPAPAELGDGKCPRWSASELRAWLLAGAPSRVRWEAQRRSFLKAVGAA